MELNKKQKLTFIIIVSIVLALSITGVYYYSSMSKPITRYNFYGTELEFRDNLRKAQNISAYPSEEDILHKVWDPDITKINIVYVLTENASDENSMVALNVFEVRFKLEVAYRNPRFNWMNEFSFEELKSFAGINHSNDTLVIALVRPSLSDRTAVELNDSVVYIKGTTREGFDMATIKFIMSALNITV